MPSRAVIDEFLGQKRLAVIGVSRNPQEFANILFRTLQQRGYSVVPVNPQATELEGQPCYASVRDIPELVDGALVLVPAAASASVVRDCKAAGIKRVWLHRGAGTGAVSPEAVNAARLAGMDVVDGACPMMFLGGWFHKVHRFFTRFDP